MKKIILISFLILSYLFSEGQIQWGTPNWLPQSNENQTTGFKGAVQTWVGFADAVYTDTGTANSSPQNIKRIPFFRIATSSDNNEWYRSSDASHWVLFSNGISSPDLQHVTDVGNHTTDSINVINGSGKRLVENDWVNDMGGGHGEINILQATTNPELLTLLSGGFHFHDYALGTDYLISYYGDGGSHTLAFPAASGYLTNSVNGVQANSSGNITLPTILPNGSFARSYVVVQDTVTHLDSLVYLPPCPIVVDSIKSGTGGSFNVVTTAGYNYNVTTGSSGVTSIATTSPITGGTITSTGTIACATCVVATVNPSAGVAHFAGSTQTTTSSLIVNSDITNGTIVASTKLSATGTPSSTTYLRGDNTWSTVSGGSSGIDSVRKSYDSANQYKSGVESFAFRMMRIYYPADSGAVADSGTTDNTVPIQKCINACANTGGIIYLGYGQWWCKGALITSENGVNPNSVLYIPPVAATSATRAHIEIMGEAPPNFTTSPLYGNSSIVKTGTVLKCTTTGSGSYPSFIGGIGSSGSPAFTYDYLTIENLTIYVSANAGSTGPTLTAINGTNIASVIVKNCVVGIDTSLYNDTSSANQVAGIITTQETGEEMSRVQDTYVFGFRYGVIAGEHSVLDNVVIGSCNYGFVFVGGGSSGNHQEIAYDIISQWNKNDVYIPNYSTFMGQTSVGGATNFAINMLRLETYGQTSRWFNNVATVVDSGNNGKGTIIYNNIPVGVGFGNSSFIQYSGGSSTPGITCINTPAPYLIPATIYSTDVVNRNTTYAISLGKSVSSSAPFAINDGLVVNNGTGDLTVDNIVATGKVNLVAGGSSTKQFTLNTNGSIVVTSSGTSAAGFTTSGTSNYCYINTASNKNGGLQLQNNTANEWYFANVGASSNQFQLLNSDANGNATVFQALQSGAIQMAHYGAGAATFDASGNITSASDERLKNIQGFYKVGLNQIMKLKPIFYKWNKLSGLEMDSTYAGFSAQNVKANIPYGTGTDKNGYLSLQDRAIIAALVNSVQEEQKEIIELKKEIKKLKK